MGLKLVPLPRKGLKVIDSFSPLGSARKSPIILIYLYFCHFPQTFGWGLGKHVRFMIVEQSDGALSAASAIGFIRMQFCVDPSRMSERRHDVVDRSSRVGEFPTELLA